MSMKLKAPYIFLLLLSIASLLCVYFVEYILHIVACPLCIYQRFPYLVLIMLSIISLSDEKDYTNYYIITILCAIFLASYHTGIERGLFELSSFCKPLISITDNLSVTDFKKMLYAKPLASCNKAALIIFGLSMTEWNLILNLALLVLFIKLKVDINRRV